mgnify:CR=1 FL=1
MCERSENLKLTESKLPDFRLLEINEIREIKAAKNYKLTEETH